MQAHAPELNALAGRWIGGGVTHVVIGAADEEPELVEQTQGLDKGFPLSPAFYCLTVRDALAATQGICARWMLGRAWSPTWTTPTWLVGLRRSSPVWVRSVARCAALGVRSTRASVSCVAGRNAEAAGEEGSPRDVADDRTGVPLDTMMDVTQPTAFLSRHASYMWRLQELHAAGLPLVHVLAYAHVLRAIPVGHWLASEADGQVVATAQGHLGVEFKELRRD